MEKLLLRPGLNSQRTPLLNTGGWSFSNLIRFREGLPETYGGWVAFLTSGATTLQGVPRGCHGWATLAGIASMGVGTYERLYVIQYGQSYDITPIAQTTTPTNPFTISGTTVTVSDPGLTVLPAVGDFVEISGATAVGGVTLSGEYTIQTVISSTSYTITAASSGSGGPGGGTPTLAYLLPIGPVNAMLGSGWGAGTWGAGTWGTPRTTGGTNTLPRIWTLDNFGEYLIACPRGGSIYEWQPATGTSTRASLISNNAPATVNAIAVSNGAEQIFAFGSIPAGGGAFDPMLVSWCNSGDPTTWLASATNNAGNFHLTDGSQIMAGLRASQQIIIWTDTALWSAQFIAGELIYSFQQLGTNCGLIGPQAAGVTNIGAYWMSPLNFMVYNGTAQVIDCPIRDLVYGNLNLQQVSKITCGVNSQFNEVRWDFPSAASEENDSFVIFNYADSTWSFSSNLLSNGLIVARTAWSDVGVFGTPVAFDANGGAWNHEVGYAANGAALPFFLQSGEIDIAEGQQMMFCDLMLPDQKMTTSGSPDGPPAGAVNYTIFAQRYSADGQMAPAQAPYMATPATETIPFRVRGRQLAFLVANPNIVGLFWRLGAIRIRVAPDGRN
jgi:hypothetical protein